MLDIKSVIPLLLILFCTVDCKIKVEESRFWPIAPNVPVQILDRDQSFKKLNIGLGTMRKCPNYMIRYRDQDIKDGYQCQSMFAHCAYVNDTQDRCI